MALAASVGISMPSLSLHTLTREMLGFLAVPFFVPSLEG